MGEALALSVLITARDLASPVLHLLGMTGLASMNPLVGTAVAMGAAILGVGTASIEAATGYDQAMHKIRALTITNDEEMNYFNEQILKLSPSLDMSAESMANALYFIKSAGFNGADAMSVLSYSAKAATAGMTDQKTVADALTSVMNSYKDQLKAIGPISDQAGYSIDVLNKMVSEGKMDWSSFVSTIGFTAATAANMGIKLDELGATIATLSSVSGSHGIRRMENDANNLFRSLEDINQVTKRVGNATKSIGLADTFDQANFAIAPFIDKLKMLAAQVGYKPGEYNLDQNAKVLNQFQTLLQTKGQDAADKFLALNQAKSVSAFEKVVGGAAALIPALVLLSDSAKTYSGDLSVMTEKTGEFGQSTERSFQIMRDSAGQQLKMLGLSIQNIGVTIGLQLLPYVKTVAEGLRSWSLRIVDLLNAPGFFAHLADSLKYIAIVIGVVLLPNLIAMMIPIAGFLAMVALIVVAGIGLQKVVEHFGGINAILKDLQPTLKVLGEGFKFFKDQLNAAFNTPEMHKALADLKKAFTELGPTLRFFGMIIIGILLVAFFALIGAIRIIGFVLPVLIEIGIKVGLVFQTIGQIIYNFFVGIPGFAQKAGAAIQNWFIMVGNTIGSWVNNVGTFFGNLGTSISTAFSTAFTAVNNTIHSWINNVGNFFSTLGTNISTGFTNAIHAGIGGIQGVFTLVKNAIAIAFQNIYNTAVIIWDDFVSLTPRKIGYALGFAIGSIIKFVGNSYNAWQTWRDHIYSIIGEFVTSIPGRISRFTTETFTAFVQWGKDTGNAILQWGKDSEKAITDFGGNAYHAFIQWGKDSGKAITNFGGNAYHAFIQWGKNTGSSVRQWGTDTYHEFVRWGKDTLNTILQWGKDAIKGFDDFVNSAPQRIKKWAIDSYNAFVQWVTDTGKAFDKWRTDTAATIDKFVQNGYTGAVNFIKGFVKGVGDGLGNAVKSVKDFFGGVVQGFKDALGIRSPSTVMHAAGQNFVQGFINGFKSMNVAQAWMNHLSGIASTGSATSLALSVGGGGGGSSFMGSGTQNQTWNLQFPNATDTNQIKQAILDVQRDQYRSARRGGGYQGVRAGI